MHRVSNFYFFLVQTRRAASLLLILIFFKTFAPTPLSFGRRAMSKRGEGLGERCVLSRFRALILFTFYL